MLWSEKAEGISWFQTIAVLLLLQCSSPSGTWLPGLMVTSAAFPTIIQRALSALWRLAEGQSHQMGFQSCRRSLSLCDSPAPCAVACFFDKSFPKAFNGVQMHIAGLLIYPGSTARKLVFTNVARRLLPGAAWRLSQREDRCRGEPNGIHLPHGLLLCVRSPALRVRSIGPVFAMRT